MIISIFLTAIVLWIVIQHYRRVSRLPPGPFSLPILGNIPMIFYYAWRAGGVVPMMSMMKRKYGNVFTIWIGTIPHVSVTDFETCHEVFAKSGNRFSDKAFSPIFNEARNGFGMIAINGSIWQEMRRFSLQTFRNMGIGKDLMELRIMSELDLRCRDIDEESIDGVTEVNATEFFDLIAGSIINTLLIGIRFEKGNSHHFLRLKMLIEESTKVLSPIDVMLPIWFLKIFLKRRYCKKTPTKMLSGQSAIPKSILSLKSVLTDLWIAGQETTATTLVSGFCQLLNHPNVMEKIRDELLHVVGSRPLTLKDKSETPYLNAVIAEIQRHASILNINFFKINHEVTEIGGHPVDAGALVTAQLSSLHSDETTYSNPNVFDPEKFVNDKNLSQKLIPFGIGKRACTGEALARAELYLIIGNLLLRYKFKSSGPLVSNIDDAPYSFAKKPRGYKMQLIKI
ncbi:hypothetical protein L5515_005740 [Caenorhabditis briggsae]|uniref:CYtochrome P450 family n=1 Tax=Caenorhabditis briggsae TaxID=6238 RepID=A0AAE9JJY6_CAEBR|nr:hypothetical protein L5515_005740 [Caenorhabditis briggsae]